MQQRRPLAIQIKSKAMIIKNSALKLVTLLAAISVASPVLAARTSITSMRDYTNYPLFARPQVPPVTLFALSIDHQLFNKAYTDYTNLDADPEIETTFDLQVEYAGYFDSALCYSYTAGIFEATARRDDTTKLCSGAWSGNFLNWVTMTRLDVLRWVLYGGKRSSDTATETVLERAHIPQDGHSFAKVYSDTSGAPVSGLTPFNIPTITFCNTTSTGDASATTTSPPVIQAAVGNWETWILMERYQCDFNRGNARAPNDVSAVTGNGASSTYTVRVRVCGSTPALRESFCQGYQNSTTGVVTYKPVGLLQEFGERADGIQFGLVSGSYDRPRAGGVLRSPIGSVGSPGAAGVGEIDLETGRFKNQAATTGIIGTLDRVRMTRYSRDTWRDCSGPGIPNNFLRDDAVTATAPPGAFFNGAQTKCSMWGNPISEIYAEALRYLAGETTPTGDFAAADDAANYLTGMPEATTWTDPFLNRAECTNCNVVVLSTGLNSFDRDQIPAVPVAGNDAERIAAMNLIGAQENIGTNVLTGAVTADGSTDGITTAVNASERTCSAKTIGNGELATLSGICPEVGSLQGGFDIAGLAYRAFTNDMRPSTSQPGDQKFRSFTIALAEALPSIDIPVGTGKITLLPFAQSATGNVADVFKASSIVNFRPGFLIGRKRITVTPDVRGDGDICRGASPDNANCTWYGYRSGNSDVRGSYVVNWEDSTWGNDYDQDGVQVLSYCVGSACSLSEDGDAIPDICQNATDSPGVCAAPAYAFTGGQLYLRTETVDTAAGFAIRFGWITAGSDIPGADTPFLKGQGVNRNCLDGDNCFAGGWSRPQVRTYSPAASNSAKLLESPLWYAAKYGNFEDSNNNKLPDVQSEWDAFNLNNQPIPDGIPDSFFPVRNPNLLKSQLRIALDRIAGGRASGTSAAVVSSSGDGAGSIFQALYTEELKLNAEKVNWTGTVRGLWITNDGKFAEDTNGNKLFDVAPTDATISFQVNAQGEVEILRNGVASLVPIKPIWDAETAMQDIPTATIDSNRAYTNLANTGRHILTWIDADNDGLVDAGEQRDFETGTFDDSQFWRLNSNLKAEAHSIVNWVRGDNTQTNMRKRSLTVGGTEKVFRLGDIVNSAPLVIGEPAGNFDLLYDDGTYTAYRQKYSKRRNVVYAGSNGGKIHAFNGGFTKKATETNPTRGFTVSPPAGGSGAAHPLGAELWAYVPKNLLSHLRWLTEINYTHVFYVDGSPLSVDVKAFTPSARNPGGWGTILIVPFRFGGGPIAIDSNDADTTPDAISLPAYVIMDVTDPEAPPRLLAEIVLPNNVSTANISSNPIRAGSGATRSTYPLARPAVAFDQSLVGGVLTYRYDMLIGSGPTRLAPEVYSERAASIYTYNLKSIIGNGGAAPTRTDNLARANSFVTDINGADTDIGGTTDSIYFGISAGQPTVVPATNPVIYTNDAMTGGLYKMVYEKAGVIGSNGVTQPSGEVLIQAPALFFDTAKPVQSRAAISISVRDLPAVIFGTGRMLSRGDFRSGNGNSLYIADDISPYTNRNFQGAIGVVALPTVTGTLTNTAVSDYRTLSDEQAIKLDMNSYPTRAGERSFTSPAVFRGIAVFTQFEPENNVCAALGKSRLTQVNFANATAPDVTESGLGGGTTSSGVASDPRIFVPTPPPPCTGTNCTNTPVTAGIVTQDSTGSLNIASSLEVGIEGTGEQGWFEPREN
jgi:type IV pilus assembly protein PilY1